APLVAVESAQAVGTRAVAEQIVTAVGDRAGEVRAVARTVEGEEGVRKGGVGSVEGAKRRYGVDVDAAAVTEARLPPAGDDGPAIEVVVTVVLLAGDRAVAVREVVPGNGVLAQVRVAEDVDGTPASLASAGVMAGRPGER